MNRISVSVVALVAFCVVGVPASAQSYWQVVTGSSAWGTASNWNPAAVPDGTGSIIILNGAATANNPAQTANRTITVDATHVIGAATFNNDLSTFTNTLSTGTAGSLNFDASGSGPAEIDAIGGGTGNTTISSPMNFVDNVVANVTNTTASSAAGALNLTGTISGPGGFTKGGDGLSTFGTGAKTYTGPTAVTGGRMRISNAAQPSGTASITINGGQIDFITAGSYTLGPGTLYLSGAGPSSGPFAPFPGVIRPDTNLAITITNTTELLSNSVVHSQGSTGGVITFSGAIGGVGGFIAGAIPHDSNEGRIVFNGANTYQGGTTVQCGTLEVSGATATLGTGDVTVASAGATGGGVARLQIDSGVTNAIGDTKTLSLAGGGTAGVADDGYINLGSGITETVGGLVLGGVAQTIAGTYGATGSGATNINDEYFSGPGVVNLQFVPEPSMLSLFACGSMLLVRRNRRLLAKNG